MIRQFILVDHSIIDPSGHFLEYARSVLGAAKAEGFHTVLAVNKSAHKIDCPEADLILNIFSNTFWDNQGLSRIRRVVRFILKKTTMAINLVDAKKFAKELGVLIGKVRVAENDLVFIPTLGGTELMGISLYSASNPSVSARWHLLFRRDIPLIDGWFDLRNRMIRWQAKSSFNLANNAFRSGSLSFYTDTDELTTLYNSLGVGDFQTLPIPIDLHLGHKRPWYQGPLVVSYIGDLRHEKGIHHLPEIINRLRNDGFDDSKVVFRIQCNLPYGVATHSILRTKESLQNNTFRGVEILEGPLNREAYRELLLGSDIVLLPYSEANYASRSSGIFAEAAAAGIPTIHPLSSWMGRNADFGYTRASDIAGDLKDMLRSYKKREKASLEFSRNWREKHSSMRLIEILKGNSEIQKNRELRSR